MNQRKNQQGFTLIELMLSVLVLAIVLAIALPSYRDFADRGKASEGYALAYGLVDDMLEFEQFAGALPTTLGDINKGFPADHAGRYVTSVALNADSTISATFGGPDAGNLAGTILTLVPFVNNAGDYQFVCHPIIPANLNVVVAAPIQPTTVPSNLLPQNCRT